MGRGIAGSLAAVQPGRVSVGADAEAGDNSGYRSVARGNDERTGAVRPFGPFRFGKLLYVQDRNASMHFSHGWARLHLVLRRRQLSHACLGAFCGIGPTPIIPQSFERDIE